MRAINQQGALCEAPRRLSSAALRSGSIVVVYATPTAAAGAAADYHVTVARSPYIIISSRPALINPPTFHLISRVLYIVGRCSKFSQLSAHWRRQLWGTGARAPPNPLDFQI